MLFTWTISKIVQNSVQKSFLGSFTFLKSKKQTNKKQIKIVRQVICISLKHTQLAKFILFIDLAAATRLADWCAGSL